jgi:ligand-binding sensor domain-containing protein/signal transduction histidine kinase
MLKAIHQYLFILFLFCMPTQLAGQPLTFRVLSLSEGLPQSQVTAVMIDSKSYVWVATKSGGLVRYDGKSFHSFGNQHGQVPRETVHCMYEASDHTLYFGSERGLYSKTDTFRLINTITSRINAIAPLQNSVLLFGGTAGLFSLQTKTGNSIQLNKDDIGQVLAIQTGSKKYWVGTTKGLYTFDPLSKEIHFIAKMIGQGVYDIEVVHDNIIALASWNAGIILYNTSTAIIDTVYRHPDLRLAQCLLLIDSMLWIGTQDNGLVALDLKKQKHIAYGESEGLPHINVKSIALDRNGQCWIGTLGGGLAIGNKQNFRQYDRSDGLASNRVYGIGTSTKYLSKIPDTWITAGDKFQHLTATGITTYDPDSLTRGVKCKSILRDNQNRTWVGTEGRGVIMMEGTTMRLINHLQGLADPYVQQLASDSLGNIFIATFTGGLFKIVESGNASIEVVSIQLPFTRITSLYIDLSQCLWIGSFEGEIVCLRNEKIIAQASTESGLPNQPIKAIILDKQNQVWAGTENRGIWTANANEDTLRFTSLELPLNSNNIYLLINDANGNTWAGTEKGVNKISRNQDGVVSGVTVYGRSEGFAGIETTHNAAMADQQGYLWFGTMNGLMRYTSGETQQNNTTPLIHFEDVRLFFKSLTQTEYAHAWNPATGVLIENIKFSPRDNHISFQFKAIDLLRPDEILCRWRLAEIEKSWSPPTTQSSVNYAALQPGKYTLFVQAATDTTEWSEPITASFIIEPPYWQTTSFTILLIVAIATFIMASVYLWTYFVRRRERRKRQHLELENTVLQLEQKALQLQMNPHFLFNALTSIKAMVGRSQLDQAQEEINNFAKLMRGVLNNSRKPLISLQEEIDVLEQYLHIEQVCHQDKFEYKIEVDDNVDTAEIDLPPMLIQPFVENAVVHGVSHLQQQGMINVRFTREGDVLVCEIRDNGIGRERAAILRAEKKPGHQPVAMEVTSERLAVLWKASDQQPLLTKDVINERGEVAGTQVIIRIPIQNAWS